jgi:hypothetical protein
MSTIVQDQVMPDGRQRRWKTIIFVLSLLVVVAVAVWQLALPALRANRAAGGVVTAQNQWEAQGIHSYQFDLQVGCFCIFDLVRPVRIVVANGEVSSITYLDDGESADPALFNGYATMDQLFAQLADAQAQNPVKFDVTYDEALGIPLSADIDVSEMIADEELRFTVTNFEARQ